MNFTEAQRSSPSVYFPVAAHIKEDNEGFTSSFQITTWNFKNAPGLNINSEIIKKIIFVLQTTNILAVPEMDPDVLFELRKNINQTRFQIVVTNSKYEKKSAIIFKQATFEYIRDRTHLGIYTETEETIHELLIRNKKTNTLYQIFNTSLSTKQKEALFQLGEFINSKLDYRAKIFFLTCNHTEFPEKIASTLKTIKQLKFMPVKMSCATSTWMDTSITTDHMFIAFDPSILPYSHMTACLYEQGLGYDLEKDFMECGPLENAFPGHSLPKDVLLLIFGSLPKNILVQVAQVCRCWKKLVRKTQILALNKGSKLSDILDPKIKTAREALEWLKKDRKECELLTNANFWRFQDFNEDILEELISICPNLRHLFFESTEMSQIKRLPKRLESLSIACLKITTLPEFPTTLKKLEINCCYKLLTIRNLPPFLQEFKCRNNDSLKYFTNFPNSLLTFHLEHCQKIIEIPPLPHSLQTLVIKGCYTLKNLSSFPPNLLYFDCDNCPLLVSLPHFPQSIISLKISRLPLKFLPKFSDELQELECSSCKFLFIIPKLPEKLRKFECSCCPEIKILPNLPEFLEEFRCYNFAGSALPQLPHFLLKFDCSKSENLVSLPFLPHSLQNFHCNECTALISLPDLPESLLSFSCGNTNLTFLPELPDSILGFSCQGCSNLQTLPKLPYYLQYLICNHCTQLTSLPELPPKLENLECGYCTSLHNLPNLPESLHTLRCYWCSNLRSFPTLPKFLVVLQSYHCSNIEVIPEIPPTLSFLDCHDSESLMHVPHLPLTLDYCYFYDCDSLTDESYQNIDQFHLHKKRQFVNSRLDIILAYPQEF